MTLSEIMGKGHAKSRMYHILNGDGTLIEKYFQEDIIMPQAKPGYKAGNSAIDDLNEEFAEQELTRKLNRLKGLSDKFRSNIL